MYCPVARICRVAPSWIDCGPVTDNSDVDEAFFEAKIMVSVRGGAARGVPSAATILPVASGVSVFGDDSVSTLGPVQCLRFMTGCSLKTFEGIRGCAANGRQRLNENVVMAMRERNSSLRRYALGEESKFCNATYSDAHECPTCVCFRVISYNLKWHRRLPPKEKPFLRWEIRRESRRPGGRAG
jgi:hypothetical protein